MEARNNWPAKGLPRNSSSSVANLFSMGIKTFECPGQSQGSQRFWRRTHNVREMLIKPARTTPRTIGPISRNRRLRAHLWRIARGMPTTPLTPSDRRRGHSRIKAYKRTSMWTPKTEPLLSRPIETQVTGLICPPSPGHQPCQSPESIS